MTSFYAKILILGWKCQILRRRNAIITTLEVVLPILILLLQSYIYRTISSSQRSRGSGTNYLSEQEDQLFWDYLRGNFDVAYSPASNNTDKIMQDIFKTVNLLHPGIVTLHPKRSEREINQWLFERTQLDQLDSEIGSPEMGIIFSKLDPKNHQYIVEMRTTSPNMKTNRRQEDEEMSILVYKSTLFLAIQTFIEKILVQSARVEQKEMNFDYIEGNQTGTFHESPHNIYDTTYVFTPLPSLDNDVLFLTTTLYVFLVFAFLFQVLSVIRDVIIEKETGTKELMKVMGVDSWMIWFHWFIYIMMTQLIVIIAATLFLTVLRPVVIEAGVLIVFILFLLFIINLTVMLFALSCLFYKTTGAITICLISWFVLNTIVFLKVVAQPQEIHLIVELFASLFPVVNLCWALSSLWSFKSYGVDWTWSYLFTQGITRFRLSVGVSIISFIVSTLINVLILIYLDAIYPGPYGVPKPLTFPCQWLRDRFQLNETQEEEEITHKSSENFEPVSKNAKVGISLRGLRKEYGFFNKNVAVENVDLDIYEGEITALLGHNGAGKTTTMSMITGMTAPTKGVIMFEGQDITLKKGFLRENLGLCTQHDLYIAKLTVIENIMFFGMLKGMSYYQAKSTGRKLLYKLDMLDKETSRGSKLSGGLKRRLCLAVALTGDPKVLILDEPTSGLDPETRRVIWDIILQMRGERTVLITTHFMEEADVLGDRIAIMDHGRVVCCGTSIFLKKLFGAGYQVHVLKSAKAPVEDISAVVKQYIPQPKVNVISDVQVDFIIKEDLINKFPALFSGLESQKSLGIVGVTVTCASMEDVFLKVANFAVGDSQSPPDGQPLSSALNINEFERLEGAQLICHQVQALFRRRYIILKRNIVSLMIKGLFILLLTFYMTTSIPIEKNKYVEQMKLELNLQVYPGTSVLMAYHKSFEGFGDIAEKVAQAMSGKVKIFSKIKDLDDYVIQQATSNNVNYVRNVLCALKFTRKFITINYHDQKYPHAAAIAVNFVSNVLLNSNGTGLIKVINHPFVNTDASGVCDKSKTNQFSMELFVVYPFLLIFAISFILLLGNPLSLIIEERVSGFKHQQYLAGAPPHFYWIVNLIFDFLIYFFVICLLLVIFISFGPQTIFSWLGTFWLVLILQGVSGISMTYLFSYIFDSPGSSFAMYNVLMICLGVFPALIVSTGLLSFFPVITFHLFLLIIFILSLNPFSATILCLRYILRAVLFEEVCRVCLDTKCHHDSEVFKWPTSTGLLESKGIYPYLLMLIITSILYPVIVLLIDCSALKQLLMFVMSREPDFTTPDDTEEDVKKEVDRVKAFKYDEIDTPLRVESLEKKYLFGTKAVNKVSFLVMRGDCFGLLGVNGAGKTTTFKMLTAEIIPDRGDAYVNSLSVKADRQAFMSSVGYCPQTNGILPSLTGVELLSIVARLRGIPSTDVSNAVTLWLDVMGILEHGHKRSGAYSGGTKRKLSTAMALIGSPEVVFLDEPTTGVDPASRRKLWTVIKDMQKQGQAVVLTSHSMEECEALCTRLTIMVAGRMRCIGNVEYLKAKFGKGFSVLIKLNEHTQRDVLKLKADFNVIFPANAIKDEHDILIHYTILDATLPLSRLFADMLQFKNDHPIVADFAASNTTLEDLFLSFATNTQMRT